MVCPPELVFERLVKINDHHDPGLDGNAEERNISHRDGNAEVVFEQPLQQQSPSRRNGREDQDEVSATE
jgi:hypothetical protein